MKRSIYWVIILLFCLSISPGYSRDSYPRTAALDALRYSINLEFQVSNDEIRAETEILLAVTDDNVKEVALDFVGLTVDEVKENGKIVKFERHAGRLHIFLHKTYGRGNRITLRIKYRGQLSEGLYIKKNKFGDRTFAANNFPDRARFRIPSIDHPYDKAAVDFFVTAPAGYEIIANGVKLATKNLSNGSRLTHWREDNPIPVYCMVVAATNYSISDVKASENIPLSFYLFPKDKENGIKACEKAEQALNFYSKMIAPYPYKKLALVEAFVSFGAMENASNIFLDERTFKDEYQISDVEYNESTVAHEIAHQWFGNSVTIEDWYEIWLSEGFATYLDYLFSEHLAGRAALLKRLQTAKEIYFKATITNKLPVYNPEIGTDYLRLINRNNYEKGAWILHMLCHLMGDERFFAALRDYYYTYEGHNVKIADFQKVMESHAEQALDWFFKQWIYQPGYPIYEVTWHWDKETKLLSVRFTQKQAKILFRMPLDVNINLGNTVRRERLQITERDQVFKIKQDEKPASITIDPDEGILKDLSTKEEN
jgi:aminopeptidase N